MGVEGPQIDPLSTGQLRAPMLTDLMQSMGMKEAVGAIANEIKQRWVAAFPRETGRGEESARVTYHRRKTRYDNRWEAEFSAGGPRARHVPIIDAQQHILAQVLRDMGFNIGDTATVAPPREPKTTTVYHRTSASKAESIMREGFRPRYREGGEPIDPSRQEYGYFTDDPDALKAYGSRLLRTELPTSVLENDPGSGHYRVRLEHLQGASFRDMAAREDEGGITSGTVRQATPEMTASTVRSADTQSILDRADALNRAGRRIGSRARDADYRALRSSLESLGSGPGAEEARAQGRFAMQTYQQLREARGLPPEPD